MPQKGRESAIPKDHLGRCPPQHARLVARRRHELKREGRELGSTLVASRARLLTAETSRPGEGLRVVGKDSVLPDATKKNKPDGYRWGRESLAEIHAATADEAVAVLCSSVAGAVD